MISKITLLDSLSEDILHMLCFRSTNFFRGLPRTLGVSSSTFKRNITFLKKNKFIKSWTFVLNPTILAKNKILFFFLKTNPNEPEIVSKLLHKYNNNELSNLVGITGNYSLIGQFHYPDPSSFLDDLVLRSTFRDGALVLHVDDIDSSIDAILRRLIEHKYVISSINTRRTTLEDVFLSLTGRGLK